MNAVFWALVGVLTGAGIVLTGLYIYLIRWLKDWW